MPATCSLAASRSLALRSGSLVVAMAVSASWPSVPAPSRPGVEDPFSTPSASRMRTAVGGVLVTKVNDRSS